MNFCRETVLVVGGSPFVNGMTLTVGRAHLRLLCPPPQIHFTLLVKKGGQRLRLDYLGS